MPRARGGPRGRAFLAPHPPTPYTLPNTRARLPLFCVCPPRPSPTPLLQLRVAQVTGGAASKVGKIKQTRKNIARVLTVINQKARAAYTKQVAKLPNNQRPKVLREKKTRAIRRALTKKEVRLGAGLSGAGLLPTVVVVVVVVVLLLLLLTVLLPLLLADACALRSALPVALSRLTPPHPLPLPLRLARAAGRADDQAEEEDRQLHAQEVRGHCIK